MIRQNYFEAAAYQFVNTQLNFPETQILDKSANIINGQRTIKVSLIGKEVPQDSIAMIESRLPQYGLGGTRLLISQGYGQNNIDINSLNSMMFQDIYKDNQQKIERQNRCIDSLLAVVEHCRQYDSIGIAIAPELKVLFPKVKEIAISQMIFSDIDSSRLDTVTTAITRYSHPLNQEEEKQFQKWLEARIGAKSIYVLNEN